MKVGVQSIIWGTNFENIEAILSEASQLGFEGVEFCQSPDILPSPKEMIELLKDYDLKLLGPSGGNLRSRLDYARASSSEYVYADEWDEQAFTEEFVNCKNIPIPVGIHPHLYKEIGTIEQASKLLEKHEWLNLILDIGHQFLADDDVIAPLERYTKRVPAIHLRDWTDRYGKSPFRFAGGFCTLGDGILSEKIRDLIEYLKRSNYPGWIIVEQDNPKQSAYECAERSLRWLSDSKLISLQQIGPSNKGHIRNISRVGEITEPSKLVVAPRNVDTHLIEHIEAAIQSTACQDIDSLFGTAAKELMLV